MTAFQHRLTALIAVLFFSSSAGAGVTDAGDAGFTLAVETSINAARADVYDAFVKQVGQWWSPALTVTGYAEALYIDARPMGCFCEALANGGIVHLTVTLVDANSMLRLTGGFGPLGLMGVSGNMTVEFNDTESGTAVALQYAVGGYHPDGLETLAPQVDAVLAEQLARLKRYIESGSPEAAE